MTNKELYNILNKTISLESTEISLKGDWQFNNQLSFMDAKKNDEVLNVNIAKKIFTYLNQSNKWLHWEVQNYNVE